MLLMSLVALAALVTIILLSIFFVSRASTRRAQATEGVGSEVTLIQKRAMEADQNLVQAMLSGTLVDTAIDNFFRERSGLLSTGPTDEPWKWSAEDLEAYREASIQRSHEAISRRILLPAIGSTLFVILVAAGLLVLLYPAPVEQREDTPRITSVPIAPPVNPSRP